MVSCLHAGLAVQGGHEGGTGVLIMDHRRSENSQQREPSRRASSFLTSAWLYLGLKGSRGESTVARWIPALCELPESLRRRQATLDKPPGMEFEEWEKPPSTQNAVSSSRSFLRRAAGWLSRPTFWLKQNHESLIYSSSRKHGTKEVEMSFLNLTIRALQVPPRNQKTDHQVFVVHL